MDPLSISLAVITLIGTTHKVIRFLSNVENAPQEMSECLIEVTSAYALLNQLKNRLEGTDKSASWFDKLSALRVEGGPFDQYTTALEQLQSKLDPARSGVIHRVGKAIAWQFKKKELEGILEKLERFKSSIQFILANSHLVSSELSLSIKQDTSDIKQTTQNFENKKEREDLMKWLNKNTFDYSALQNDKIRDRKDGTGSWFLTSPEFESWKTSENCSLICPGIAGAGKTIIIAKTVHHLRESHLPNTGVAVIYFDYKMAADQKPSKLLASVALQLITTLETLPDCVNDFFKKHKGSAPSWEDYQNLIQALVPVFNDVYLMVDAFDEFFSDTEDREQFLDCIRAIQSQSRLKTMVTSRPGFVLEKDFNHSHSIEIRASDADMEAYLEQRKRSCSTCVKNDKTWPSVRNNIIKAADGMLVSQLCVSSTFAPKLHTHLYQSAHSLRSFILFSFLFGF
ncbi:uncharacterized protein K452DRAFT_217195 [Aplosporella prunicola CBS 121167]|uniref:Nephrocystin 3-like N-terminal domain-containing protein n=1 Tax=Aplosporella prunicola CBS 121167 TaxID=1176127 RepID=A0A6A6BSE0_9PEZI|nr:uncharacterized protein K452DRAFT_217195 [Aplosporella prunicola CBS 121167]KAF2147019.1 hypothetical protein K452DRAFT_217195 [Aplosporella prunicola CBS 121167]